MSESIGHLKDAIISYLGRDGRFSGARIIGEFPDTEHPGALCNPVIVVGLSRVDIIPGGFGDYYGENLGSGGGLYGKSANVTIYFDIYSPSDSGAQPGERLYETLCDALIIAPSPFGFTRMWLGAISGDRSSASNRIRVCATLRGALTGLETGLSLESIIVTKDLKKE